MHRPVRRGRAQSAQVCQCVPRTIHPSDMSTCAPSTKRTGVAAGMRNERVHRVSAAADTCVSVMCGQEGRLAAYLSVWSVEFALRPSERCLAASTSRSLLRRLQTRVKMVCQRLLTLLCRLCEEVRGEW